MASQINASNSGFGGVVTSGDSSGVLQLQTASTTAVTIDTSQNVGIGTTSPTYKVDVVGQYAFQGTGYQPFITLRDSNASNQGSRIGSVAGITYFQNDNTGGGTYTERMRIDSSGNVLLGTTATSAAKLTVNGNIAPIGAPNAFWGLDYATTSSVGNYVTIANSGTYNFVSGSGATFVYEDGGTVGAVMFMSVYGTTYTVWQSGTGYSNVIGTASKVNFGYNSGAGAYYLQNLSGASRNFYISNIRMRQGS